MTTNEVPSFGKEGPSGYKWNSSKVMNLSICTCSKEKKRAEENTQTGENDGGWRRFSVPFGRVLRKTCEGTEDGFYSRHNKECGRNLEFYWKPLSSLWRVVEWWHILIRTDRPMKCTACVVVSWASEIAYPRSQRYSNGGSIAYQSTILFDARTEAASL